MYVFNFSFVCCFFFIVRIFCLKRKTVNSRHFGIRMMKFEECILLFSVTE